MVNTYATTATATGTALSNYTVSDVPGSFSITKASATVTAGGGTKVYGTAVSGADGDADRLHGGGRGNHRTERHACGGRDGQHLRDDGDGGDRNRAQQLHGLVRAGQLQHHEGVGDGDGGWRDQGLRDGGFRH